MKLITIACMYNEVEKGNLRRCLKNISKFSDEIILFDDGSTDNSVEVAKEFTQHIILGEKNDFLNETTHLKELLEKAIELKADWIFKMDIDEVLDANGTKNLRDFCEKADKEGYYFPEITLWRSDCWARKDYLGSGRFLRLWKNNGKLKFNIVHGLHADLFPQGLSRIGDAPFNVIHYGYATYEAIVERWRERTRHGVPVDIRKKSLDESQMVLEHIPHELFPEGCEPKRHEKPNPIKYCVGPDGIKKYIEGGENYVHDWIDIKWRKGHLNRLVFEENKDLMKGRILFVGCNAGTSTFLLSKYCDELIGIDINEKALERAEELFKKHNITNTKFVNCNVLEMPFTNEYFDGIYALDVAEHIYPEDFKLMMTELRRVLKKQGLLYIRVPKAGNQFEKEKEKGAYDSHHKIFFETEDKIKNYLNVPRLEIIEFAHETRANPGRPSEKHNAWRVILENVG